MKLRSFEQYSHHLESVAHDAWLTTRVKSVLAMDDPTLGLQIHVKTHAGTVALSGRVTTHRQCEKVVALTRSVQGVVDVDARELLTHVFTPGSFPEPPDAEERSERRPPDDK
ncbi:BON domain-containing protein [Pseudomonas sp. B21-040]|jgi:hyperosmotically inducible protein|uniref:BON domain-containing protein n=1 Tax=Pseudomonas TaxID=286 RepID=UPI0005FB11AE|nr:MULTISPECIES: BON domain-containing protein [Pseudomonas]KJZ40247.1 phospholipid-binding protein [Pseudomonas fluorescens]OOG10907.1 phospholipid-binding protein [Pseudomonas sp. C9]PWK45546.1 hyperosmotically inducible protein [Pseudomonas sp. OV226]UVL42927.1 BON domain-containing protein [Pseudomonas sp. B21-040]